MPQRFATYTITFPPSHPMARLSPTTTLKATGRVVHFTELKDGAVFLLLRDKCVYQKPGDHHVVRLIPWDGEGFTTLLGDPLCEVLREVKARKKRENPDLPDLPS